MQRQRTDGYIRKIEFVFYNEQRIRAAVLDARNQPRSQGNDPSKISDPTAVQAIRNATPLRKVRLADEDLYKPEKWLKVVDATYKWCDTDRFVVAKDRYSGVDYRQTCAKLSISVRLYYFMLDDIRRYAALCAAQLGVIKIF